MKLLTLAALTGGPKHGYLIIKEIRRVSEGFSGLREGTLYPVLHILEDEGCLKSEWKANPSGRDRKYYKITAKGRAALRAQKEEWAKMVEAVGAAIAGL